MVRKFNWNRLKVLDLINIKSSLRYESILTDVFKYYERAGSPLLIHNKSEKNIVGLKGNLLIDKRTKRSKRTLDDLVEKLRELILVSPIEKGDEHQYSAEEIFLSKIFPDSELRSLLKMVRKEDPSSREDFKNEISITLVEVFSHYYEILDHEFMVKINLSILKKAYGEWESLTTKELEEFINSLRSHFRPKFSRDSILYNKNNYNKIREVTRRCVERNIRNYRHWYIASNIILPNAKFLRLYN